jgi:hypothetical protein
MIYSFFSNQSLKGLIESVKINKKQKDFLLSQVPQLDLEERKALLKTLVRVYLLDLEEEEAKERIRKFWQK